MLNLFLVTMFISIAVLLVELIKPSIFKKFLKTVPKRKVIVLVCLGVIIISFIGISSSAPKMEEKKDVGTLANNVEQQAISQTTTIPETITTPSEPIITKTPETKTTQPEKSTSSPTIPTNPQYEYYSVSSVVDGDTIKVNVSGTIETLRLIGMDTPETVDPRKPVQCFGKEASNKAKELLTGKKVRIEKDSTQGDFDKYNRRLAYIYREDGLFYNKYMIEQGYAHEYTYNVPYEYQAEFKVAQKSAQDNLRGLWSPDTCNGDTTTSATDSTPSQTTTTEQSTGKYYTSSYHTSKYYYPASCPEWQNLSPSYLKVFDSLEALLVAYPSRTLSPQCQ